MKKSKKDLHEQIGDHWKVDSVGLFQEVMNNKDAAILSIPFRILQSILKEVAERDIKINDKELNKLMLRLSLYSVSDPSDPDYNSDFVNEYLES